MTRAHFDYAVPNRGIGIDDQRFAHNGLADAHQAKIIALTVATGLPVLGHGRQPLVEIVAKLCVFVHQIQKQASRKHLTNDLFIGHVGVTSLALEHGQGTKQIAVRELRNHVQRIALNGIAVVFLDFAFDD